MIDASGGCQGSPRPANRHHAGTAHPRSAPLHVPEELIIAVAVLLVGSIAASFVDRLGAPTLLLFMGLGIFLGEDGPGGISFDNATLARDAGTVALMIILIEGGLLAERSEIQRALGPAGLLASLGVLVTAGVVAASAYFVADFSWTTALLLGAAVSSTDAAAVFASLRGTNVRRRLAATLEAESGFNDPFAALLVIGLVEWSTSEHFGALDGALLFVAAGRDRPRRRARRRHRRGLDAAPHAAALGRADARRHGRRGARGRGRRLGHQRLRPARRLPHRPRDRRCAHSARRGRARLPAGLRVARAAGAVRPARAAGDALADVRRGAGADPRRGRAGARGPPAGGVRCARRSSGCRCASRGSSRGRACAAASRSCSRPSRSPPACPARSASSTPSSSWSCSPSRPRA